MLILNRVVCTPYVTRGVLIYDDLPICHTLELPFYNNMQQISCIPQGVYRCTVTNHSKFGNCYRLDTVHGRSGILIHAGNSVRDTKGCILVGLDTSSGYILQSKQAMSRLLQILPTDFQLKVMETNYGLAGI